MSKNRMLLGMVTSAGFTHRLQMRMFVKEGQSWDTAMFEMDKGLYQYVHELS
jgi:hypothetical protein